MAGTESLSQKIAEVEQRLELARKELQGWQRLRESNISHEKQAAMLVESLEAQLAELRQSGE